MRWAKLISSLLHPIVMPTIGVFLFLVISELRLSRNQQLALLGLIFITTYIIPIVLLAVLKRCKLIASFNVHTIQERKIPVLVMIAIFFFLGKNLINTMLVKDLGYLFIGTAVALILLYLLFYANFKTSLHILSLGSSVGYFIVYQHLHAINILPLIVILVLLSGLLGTARLTLNAHTPREVYLGFSIGVFAQLLTFIVL